MANERERDSEVDHDARPAGGDNDDDAGTTERDDTDPTETGADPWGTATFEGNRLAQHRAFQALSFREKILRIEQMNEVAEAFRRGRAARADDTKHS